MYPRSKRKLFFNYLLFIFTIITPQKKTIYTCNLIYGKYNEYISLQYEAQPRSMGGHEMVDQLLARALHQSAQQAFILLCPTKPGKEGCVYMLQCVERRLLPWVKISSTPMSTCYDGHMVNNNNKYLKRHITKTSTWVILLQHLVQMQSK